MGALQRATPIEMALDIWTRRKWIAIVVFSAALIATVGVTVSLPDLYRATATALVEREQVSEAFVMRAPVAADLDTRIQTIKEDVMSRARLSDLIVRLDLYPELRKRAALDAVVERMRRDIRFDVRGAEQPYGRTAMISFALSYTHRDPRTAARVANAVAGVYVDENSKSRERQAARTAGFLKTQLADVKKQLDDQEQRTSEFKLQHMNELPQQFQANMFSLERLNTRLRANSDQQLRVIEQRDRLERQLSAIGPSAPSVAPPPNSPQAELLRLTQQLADLRRQYTDEYPDVIRLRNQIASLERRIAAAPPEPSAAAAPPDNSEARIKDDLRKVEAELQTLREEDRALHQAIDDYEQRVVNAPKREEELRTLSRDYETTKERYTTLLQRYEEAQLAESLERGEQVEKFRILDPALPPRGPVAPNRLRLLLLGLGLAAALAVAATAAAEWFDTSFHTIDDLRAFTRVPTLVNLPLIVTRRDVRRRRLRMALAAISVIVGLALLGAASRYVGSDNEQIVRMIDRGQA